MSQDTTSWECPVGVTHIVFEGWGPGGKNPDAGGSGFAMSGCGGGAYARGRSAVTAGNFYDIKRGLGDSFGASATVAVISGDSIVADIGGQPPGDTGGLGGTASGPDMVTGYAGGLGGSRTEPFAGPGGGGGGGASRGGAGSAGSGQTGGVGNIPGGGAGGNGGNAGSSGFIGIELGGGGGGHGAGGNGSRAGGDGAWIIWDDSAGQVGGAGGGFLPTAGAFLAGDGTYPVASTPKARRFLGYIT